MAERPTVDPRRVVRVSRLATPHPEGDYAGPGAVYVDADPARPYADHLVFTCPGCGRVGAIRATSPKSGTPPSWEVRAGSLDAPERLSLYPSIHCVGCCGWHGWLKDGVFGMEAVT